MLDAEFRGSLDALADIATAPLRKRLLDLPESALRPRRDSLYALVIPYR